MCSPRVMTLMAPATAQAQWDTAVRHVAVPGWGSSLAPRTAGVRGGTR